MKTLSKTKTYEYVSKIFIIIITLFLISLSGFAQNVGIGTTTPQGELHVSRPYDWQGVTFSGSGVDDITVYHDNYTGTTERTYIIKVSNASNDPDLFDWSDDNGSSWHTYYQMSTSPVPLDYGISVSWSSANGHTDNDQWSFTIGPSYPDGLIVKLGQVGMGTDSPASCAKLDINSNSMGVLFPRTDTTTVNISNPGGSLSAGLLIYQNGDNTFYYYDGSKWVAITKGQDVVFERNSTTVRQKGHYDTDDFIFGRNVLPQNGESVTDSMFFFDKSKSAFRAGKLTTSQNWSPDNMGLASFAFGKNTKASGDYSTAMGKNTTASGINATAMGTTTTASGDYSTTMGDSTTASGYHSTAMGYYTTAPSGYETVLGRYNTGYTPNSTNGWNDNDRLFVIGNGSSSSHSNALTILKNGNTGINVENPASLLSVNGTGASDKTLASYNSDATGTAVYGYASSTSTLLHYGGYFESNGQSGKGVYGKANGVLGSGVLGYASNTTSTNFGGYFTAEGESGRGVYGMANNTTGFNYGRYFEANGENGFGVYGYASNTTGTNYGGYFTAEGESGRGVYGYASSTSTLLHYGGYFESNGQNGKGVYGKANGVLGSGVLGYASNTTGTNYGGYFTAEGESGRGVYGMANNTTGFNYGGYFEANGENGFGVYGYASNNAGTNYGGYFTAEGESGRGVYGYASHSTGKNYGIFGKSSSTAGYGGYFEGRGYFADDFMVGTDSLPKNGESISDDLFFIDIDNAAFRGGRLNSSSNWSPYFIGDVSFAFGYNTRASGDISTAWGDQTIASGYVSTTWGKGTKAPSGYETALGRYNTDYTPNSDVGWDDNDRLFVIGNGTSSSSQSNALTILKNGRIGIGSVTSPTYALQLPNDSDNGIGHGRAYAWNTYSDTRVKFLKKPLHYGIDEIMKLVPKSYIHHSSTFEDNKLSIKDDGEKTIGLIAQEVYKIIPEAVQKPEDENKELWSMDYEKLIPVLIKGMQEQQKEIQSLKKQNAEILKRLEALESK